MKKLLSLLLACLLLALPLSAAFAEAPDLSYEENNADLYTITEDAETGEVLITSSLSAADRTFTHQYTSQYYRSSTQFDVVSSVSGDAAPALRLWIVHWTDVTFLSFEHITFTFDGHTFTFSDVAIPDLSIYARPSYMEKLLITFDSTAPDFVTALTEYCAGLGENEAFTCTMILHGAEDRTFEIELGDGFRQDFLLMQQAHAAMTGAGSSVSAPVAAENASDSAATDEAEASGDVYIVVDAAKAAVRDRAAIRLKPNISADILAYAHTGETFRLLNVIPNWYVIDVNGDTGYINQGVAKIVE